MHRLRSGCGPGGRGFESRRSPLKCLQTGTLRFTGVSGGVNAGSKSRAGEAEKRFTGRWSFAVQRRIRGMGPGTSEAEPGGRPSTLVAGAPAPSMSGDERRQSVTRLEASAASNFAAQPDDLLRAGVARSARRGPGRRAVRAAGDGADAQHP